MKWPCQAQSLFIATFQFSGTSAFMYKNKGSIFKNVHILILSGFDVSLEKNQ